MGGTVRVCGGQSSTFRGASGAASASPPAGGVGPALRVGVAAVVLLTSASAALGEDRAGAPAAPPAPEPSVADLDIDQLAKVRVSAFDVSTRLDDGYRASNSVSASRFDAPIRDLPFAVQAFTESFIHDQHPVTLFDVARYSPGVTYRSNDFNEGNANLAIRGFAVGTTPASVQVLRDGFMGPPILELTNVSRVEVVKGPSSFLYGQVAPGGIVNVITKRPQPRLAASAEATYGSYDQYRFEVDVTGPVARTLFARLPASYDQDLHYWKPYDGRSWDVAPSLLWQPHRRVSVSASYERYHKLETPQVMQKPGYNAQRGPVPTAADPNRSGVDVPGLPDTWNSMSYADYRRSDTTGVNAWVDVEAGDAWTLRAGYAHLLSDIDAAWSGNLGMANNQTLLQGRRFRRQTYTQEGDTAEVSAVGKYRTNPVSVRALLGGQLVERRFHARAGQAPNDPALGSDPIGSPLPLWDLGDPSTWNRNVDLPLSALTASPQDYEVRYRDVSGYAGLTLGFLDDRLLLLGGLRHTSTRSRQTNHVTGQSDPRITAEVVTPQVGGLVNVTPELAVFASYAESFVPAAAPLGNSDGTTRPARPSRGRGWDVGAKAELLGGRVSGTVTLFDLRNRDIVTDLATTNAQGTVVITQIQAGEQRSRGVELDATIKPTDAWQVYLSYSYLEARIAEFTGDDAGILAQDPSTLATAARENYRNARRYHGAPLQMSAPHLANLWTRYDFGRGALRGFHVAGGANFVYDQTLLPDTPPSARQTYTLVNAAVGYSHAWRPLRVGLELTGKNLAAERYRPSQSTRARPRELLLTLTGRY